MARRRISFAAWLVALICVPLSDGSSAQATRKAPTPAVPKEVLAACDMLRSVAAATPGASVRRRTGAFQDETLSSPASGCGLAISGSFARAEKTGDAATRLHDAFEHRGWQEMGAYSADGPDGTSFAFRKGAVSCLVRGTWNGGAEPDLPAQDWYRVKAFCASPTFPEKRSQ